MRVLITGGLSFIGVNLAREFVSAGHEVVLYDLSTRQSRLLGEFFDEKKIRIVRGDVTNLSHLMSLIKEHDIGGIVHLVAMLSEGDCREFPTEGMRLSVIGTQMPLEAARLAGLKRFIYVSTGAVFGHRPDWKIKIKEDDRPSPLGMYSLFKYLGEEVTRRYRVIYSVPAAVVRIAYVYGPDIITPDITLTRGPIPYFLHRALTGTPLNDPSGGDFVANYSYVKDIAHGIYCAYVSKTLPSDVYHISGGINYTTSEVLDAVKAATNRSDLSIGPGVEPYSLQTPVRGALDISRAEAELGYKVQYPLQAAIADYAAWMKRELSQRKQVA